jgi:lysophospholipid acyltransferase 5
VILNIGSIRPDTRNMASISELSRQYGLDEHAIRFLLGQISGFPIFLLYTIFIRKLPLNLQYLYIITTGIGVAYWSFGFECICHTIICIAINNLVLNYGPSGSIKSRFYTATILVLFQFGYLLVGYWNRDKWMEYEAAIDWTTPHCILCMRLMAITMDFYDGHSRYIFTIHYINIHTYIYIYIKICSNKIIFLMISSTSYS